MITFDFEQEMYDFKGLVRLMAHMTVSKLEKREEELAFIQQLADKLYDDFESSFADTERAIDACNAEHKAEVDALKEEIVTLKAAKAAPGSPKDVERVEGYWLMLMIAARNAITAGQFSAPRSDAVRRVVTEEIGA
jgi:hypothetical protein